MKFGLSDTTLANFRAVFMMHPEVEDVIIYGSRAEGNCRQGSDIDLTIKGEKVTYDLCRKIGSELDNTNSPYFVDLSVYHLLTDENLIKHIDTAGKSFL